MVQVCAGNLIVGDIPAVVTGTGLARERRGRAGGWLVGVGRRAKVEVEWEFSDWRIGKWKKRTRNVQLIGLVKV